MDMQRVRQYKRKILSLLVAKYERSQSFQTGTPSKQRPQMSLVGSDLAKDYYDEMDYRKREGIHAAIQELSQEEIITVTWPKLKENIEVNKIYLNLEGLEEAYQLTGKMPKEDKICQLDLVLAPLSKASVGVGERVVGRDKSQAPDKEAHWNGFGRPAGLSKLSPGITGLARDRGEYSETGSQPNALS